MAPYPFHKAFGRSRVTRPTRDVTALLRYALLNVLRSRRRTFSAILGVLLAVTFVAGTLIAIDSSARATLDGLIGNLSADMGFLADPSNGTAVREAAEAVPDVLGVRVFRHAGFGELTADNGTFVVGGPVQGIDPDRLPYSVGTLTVLSGTLDLPRNTTALTQSIAEALGVGLGESIAFLYAEYDVFGNRTWTLLNVTVGAIVRSDGSDVYRFGPGFNPFSAFVHIEDIDWYNEELGVRFTGNEVVGEVRVDRDRLLDPYDLEGSRRNLARLERLLGQAILPYGGRVVAGPLASILLSFSGTIAVQRLVYVSLSAPVLLLGLYLGAIGVDLGHAERRRELAILKTRGAGVRQLVGLLLLEAVLGGLIAAFLGLVAGVGLSRILLGTVGLAGQTSTARYDVLALSPSTVAIVAILGIAFMALVSIRSARRTAGLPIIETLRYYAPGETKIHYRPTVDIVLVSLGALTYGMVWYAVSNPSDFLLFLLGALFFVLLPFAPIFLIIGTTRLLTRSTGRIYEWTARACKPFAKNLHHVISKNLARNPRRSASIALIIALGIAFGMFIFVTFGSQIVYQEWQLKASIGADASASASVLDEGFRANVSALPEVSGVSRVRGLPISPPFGFASVYALEPGTFFAVSQPEPWYFRGAGPAEAQAVLETPGSVLVSEAYLRDAFLSVGDRLTFRADVFNGTGSTTVTVNATVGGTVRGLPGTGSGYGMPTAIYGSEDTFRPFLDAGSDPFFRSDRYLIDLRPGADWRTAKEGIEGLGAFDIQVLGEQLESLRSNPVFRSILGFIQMEIAFVIVILTAGLGLILYAATLERDVEFASIRARGASGWQTAGILVGEAFSIMVIGMAVGAGMGVLTAFLSTNLVSAGPGTGGETLVPLAFVVPWEAVLLVVLAPAAMMLTAVAVTWRIARMEVPRVLKMRGG